MSTIANQITRRSALKSLGATGAFVAIGGSGISLFPASGAAAYSAPQTDTDTVIVTVFLRGALDGLSLVAPEPGTDPLYSATGSGALRPKLNILTGTQDTTPMPFRLADADGGPTGFMLNGVADGMLDLWDHGELAIIHAAGSDNWTRSHFAAMDKMDRARGPAGAGGWLMNARTGGLDSLNPWSGIGLGSSPNPSLRSAIVGAAPAAPSLAQLTAKRYIEEHRRAVLGQLYAGTRYAQLLDNGLATTDLLLDIAAEETEPTTPYYIPEYSDSGASRLADAARIVNADRGVRAIAIDTAGWDTHSKQFKWLPPLISQLSDSLKRFWADLNPASRKRTVVIVMSEFGRSAKENGGRGTEHGTGNCMLVLGSNDRINGKKVHLKHDIWPGLGPAGSYPSYPKHSPVRMGLFEDRDLQPTTDFRDVFAEVITAQYGPEAVAPAIVGYKPEPVGLFRPPR